jgi:hypothetical protein
MTDFLEESAATGLSQETPASSTDARTDSPYVRIARSEALFASLLLSSALAVAPAAAVTMRSHRRDELLESSTAPADIDIDLKRETASLFDRGAGVVFEDAVLTEFSRSLIEFVAREGPAAFGAITWYVASHRRSAQAVAEALRWIADVGGNDTLRERWALLRQCLEDASPVIRDSAILGFAAIDDPRAKDVLRKVRHFEPIDELRRLIADVIAQLDRTENASVIENRP